MASGRGQTQAACMRELIRAAGEREWEDVAVPRLRAVEATAHRQEEELAKVAKRVEDTIAVLRNVEQLILQRLDQQDQLLDPMARMLTLTTLRIQAIEEHHPSPAVRERVQVLLKEVGG